MYLVQTNTTTAVQRFTGTWVKKLRDFNDSSYNNRF